ncbi:RagB/SusD family nutrient uptake outer membrane protein [Dyadobacter sp. LHD-138]|uniref:RagB/SusD family nutrient uptake outer membrane protein n=1 Tax=Dyadobacter sp. LHD-138 TaxID=3071413 RepID=UPI0027E10CC3|nr:RagB/SusD family nutrient uptake outer membrane protein [Dyadobacter sp. LHD-138]MDQ6481105.1 RagB/SusD family nutrient uptake outer membrane protein [Dyadobacter sp. LHD-138]
MRKIFANVLLIVVIFMGASCNEDFLEREATDSIPEEKIFEDPALMQLFVNNMYLDVPSFDRNLYDNITDESRCYWGGGPRNVVQGQWFADNNPMEYWAYGPVRKTNMFLAKIDEAKVDDEKKAFFKGQVKFLRAMLYFNMIKRYGGVPIITEPQGLDDDLFVARKTVDESFAFVVKELEEAVGLLPETYGSRAVDVGKANKNSAKAFLGRVLLFWASPLYNPGADAARWQKAALVNKEVMDKGVYSLHPSFRNIMLDKNNEEEIFSVQFQKPFRDHGWDSWGQPDSQSKQDAVNRSPVQEFVDTFEMKNGKAIDEPGSGYDPTNPYVNRDPRFDATVLYNGATFFGSAIYMYEGAPIDGINFPYATITGYLIRKGMNESNKDYYGGSGSDQNWIELRYAEVVLNYAEAKNESLAAPDASVYSAVELVRQRAGIAPFQLPAGLTKAQMRERIYKERYIELSFENKRYWDLRRWKKSVEVLNGKQFNAMYITKNANGTYAYKPKPVDGIPYVFQEKMYFMPIPQREIEKNPNLKQNTGW